VTIDPIIDKNMVIAQIFLSNATHIQLPNFSCQPLLFKIFGHSLWQLKNGEQFFLVCFNFLNRFMNGGD
jgi:hypothetical protein